jgi:hypothetical protein
MMTCNDSINPSNPFSGIITRELKDLFKNGINSLLECEGCTVPCRLYFGTTKYNTCESCENLSFNNIGRKSTNVSSSGSGVPVYANKQCTTCGGSGLIGVESTEIVYVIPIWDFKQWFNTGLSSGIINARNPAGMVQTFSKIDLLPKIKKAKEIRIDTNIEEYVKHDFERAGEPEPLGFGESSYIATLWKRK